MLVTFYFFYMDFVLPCKVVSYYVLMMFLRRETTWIEHNNISNPCDSNGFYGVSFLIYSDNELNSLRRIFQIAVNQKHLWMSKFKAQDHMHYLQQSGIEYCIKIKNLLTLPMTPKYLDPRPLWLRGPSLKFIDSNLSS